MATRNNDFDFWDWLLMFGGMWAIIKLFKTPTKAGIGALPNAQRKIIYYTNTSGKRVFDLEAAKLTPDELGELIRLGIKARLIPALTTPTFKRFPGNKYINGKLRDLDNGWRIFVRVIDNETIFAASFYKKGKNNDLKNEIEKAEARIKEYLQRT